MAEFVCVGAPYFLGERIERRTEVSAIRASGIAREIGADWVTVEPDSQQPDPICAINCALAQAIQAQHGAIPIVFTSDCTNALGAVKGLGGGVSVVWYDAHGDFNTPETSPSGFVGGMPLAMLVGRGDMHMMQTIDLAPLDERDVIITDARDLDPAEAVALHESAVTHLPDVGDLLTAPLPDKPLYIHLDVDVVRMQDMPAVTFQSKGGPALETVAASLERIARDAPQIAGMLVSLWNDELARDDRALQSTLTLVRAFVAGVRARG